MISAFLLWPQIIVKAVLLLILACYAAIVVISFHAFAQGEPGGFAVFYTVGQLARSASMHSLYDAAVQNAFHPASIYGGYFYHLPYEVLLLLPLSYLSRSTAFAVWVAFNLGCIISGALILAKWAGVSKLEASIATLAFSPALLVCVDGQDSGLLFLLLALTADSLMSGNQRRAGFILAMSLFKFQFAIPVMVVLGFRYRRMLGAFLLGAVGILGLCVAMVGMHGAASYFSLVHANPESPKMMANLRGLVYGISKYDHPAFVVLISAVVIIASILATRDGDDSTNVSVAVLAAWLVSYHGHLYDGIILVIPLALALSAKWSVPVVLVSPLLILFPLHVFWFAVPLAALWVGFIYPHSETPTQTSSCTPVRSEASYSLR